MRRILLVGGTIVAVMLSLGADECGTSPQSQSRLKRATVQVQVGSDGLSVEQRNVTKRIVEDNKPGAIKHLYIVSAYSGQVLVYSTVQGKVTSSGKRLNPSVVFGTKDTPTAASGFRIPFPGGDQFTGEVLADDGTYGSSVEYLYWWDARGVYHQQYVTGGMILHVSSEPLAVKSVVLNLELDRSQ